MKITLEPYNPLWAVKFDAIKRDLEAILADIPIVSIEHVGSTSIPGLPAKPVLDIDIIIPLSSLPAVRTAMSSAGYLDCGELNVPGRFAFRQPGYTLADVASGSHGGEEMRRNTYAAVEGCTALRNHLDVKRVLMNDAALREEYGRVKRDLSEKDFNNVDEYVVGKNDILMKILKKAGWTEELLDEVREANKL